MRKTLWGVLIALFVVSGTTIVYSDVIRNIYSNGINSISITGSAQVKAKTTRQPAANTNYIAIGWNDLGMHCISPRFKEMAILPPYNTLVVQVIKKGNPPSLATAGLTVEYSVLNNTTTAGKTDFWTYVLQLFGVNPVPGIGLTGKGLSGTMDINGNLFEAKGIPVLPYDDKMVWNPYQRAAIKVKDSSGAVVATTEVVIPVSDELNCQKCHFSGGPGAVGIDMPTVESNILTLHDLRNNTNLMAARPVLCASCHSDNALGAPGVAGIPSLSEAMHLKHSTLGANTPSCYDCHPGKKTNCSRSAIEGMGPVNGDPKCENCHGSLQTVADSISKGRVPWLQEPSCTQCHGSKYSTGQNLYRNSAGHGGVACSACHNSPHAWWPSTNAADNVQPIARQGHAGPIGKCTVCHKTAPKGASSPHGAASHPKGWLDRHGDTVEKSGVISCQACHGTDLAGGAGPSCYSCHGNIWGGTGDKD